MVFSVLRQDKSVKFYESLESYMSNVFDSVTSIKETINSYCDGDTESTKKHGQRVIKLENQADASRRDIERELYKGVLIPFGREEKYELVESIDDIADKAEIIYRLAEIERPPIPKNLVRDIKHLAAEVESVVKKLKSAVSHLNIDLIKSIDIASQIKVDREDVKTREYELLRKLLKQRSNYDPLDIIFLKELFSLLAKVADKAHTAADRTIALAVKYSG